MRLSVAQKVAVVLATLLAVVAGLGMTVLRQTRQLATQIDDVARSHGSRAELAGFVTALGTAESAQRAFRGAGDSSDLTLYWWARDRVQTHLGALDRSVRDPGQRARLAELRRLATVHLGELDASIDAGAAAGAPADAESHRERILALVAAMDDSGRALLARRAARVRDGERTTLVVAGAASLGAVLVALVGILVIRAELRAWARRGAALAASEARFRGAADGSMDAFCLLDPVRDESGRVVDLVVVDANARAESHFALPRPRLIGRRLGDVDPAARQSGLLDRCAAVIDTGVMVDEEVGSTAADGRPTWLHHTIVKVGDGVALTTRDITEKRRMDERLRQAQKMEAVGRLASGVAHDFNNLLTAIRASADALGMTLEGEDPRRDEVAEIASAVDRAHLLTRQLLTFSRKQAARPAAVDVNEVVSGMAGLLRRLVPDEVRLATRLAPELGLVHADPGQLEQVLLNLVVNARDAMPDGGSLEILTSNVVVPAPTPHSHGTIEAGDYIALSVADTGTGIDDATMTHLFEPFFTTKPEGKGTGLGLATTFGIVRQSGGHITVSSNPGSGARFTVLLPRLHEERGGHAPAVTAGGAPFDAGASDMTAGRGREAGGMILAA